MLVEGGQWGGTAAAPIASNIMKQLFAMDAGTPVNVAALPPLAGNFKGVTDVETHDDSSPAAATPGAAANTGGDNTPQPDAPPSLPTRASNTKGGR